jgi:uncharacterized protein (TIGR00369 family)
MLLSTRSSTAGRRARFHICSRCASMDACLRPPSRPVVVMSSQSSCPSPRSLRSWGSETFRADVLDDDEVRLRLPWDPSNVTIGDMVHGGAIATLADLTVMAAAWCGADAPPDLRGVTVSMALDYLAPARSTDVIGVGRVLRRGRSLVNCEAEIVDPRGTLIAKAIAVYKLG